MSRGNKSTDEGRPSVFDRLGPGASSVLNRRKESEQSRWEQALRKDEKNIRKSSSSPSPTPSPKPVNNLKDLEDEREEILKQLKEKPKIKPIVIAKTKRQMISPDSSIEDNSTINEKQVKKPCIRNKMSALTPLNYTHSSLTKKTEVKQIPIKHLITNEKHLEKITKTITTSPSHNIKVETESVDEKLKPAEIMKERHQSDDRKTSERRHNRKKLSNDYNEPTFSRDHKKRNSIESNTYTSNEKYEKSGENKSYKTRFNESDKSSNDHKSEYRRKATKALRKSTPEDNSRKSIDKIERKDSDRHHYVKSTDARREKRDSSYDSTKKSRIKIDFKKSKESYRDSRSHKVISDETKQRNSREIDYYKGNKNKDRSSKTRESTKRYQEKDGNIRKQKEFKDSSQYKYELKEFDQGKSQKHRLLSTDSCRDSQSDKTEEKTYSRVKEEKDISKSKHSNEKMLNVSSPDETTTEKFQIEMISDSEKNLADDDGESKASVYSDISDDELKTIDDFPAEHEIAIDRLDIDWSTLNMPLPRSSNQPTRSIMEVVYKIGLSKRFIGEKLFGEINEKCKKQLGKEFLSGDAWMHSAMVRKQEERERLLLDMGGFCKALTARKDLAIRSHLCDYSPPINLTVDQHCYKQAVQMFLSTK